MVRLAGEFVTAKRHFVNRVTYFKYKNDYIIPNPKVVYFGDKNENAFDIFSDRFFCF